VEVRLLLPTAKYFTTCSFTGTWAKRAVGLTTSQGSETASEGGIASPVWGEDRASLRTTATEAPNQRSIPRNTNPKVINLRCIASLLTASRVKGQRKSLPIIPDKAWCVKQKPARELLDSRNVGTMSWHKATQG
jgi:hypothetical protein